jgi:hypothetical protein
LLGSVEETPFELNHVLKTRNERSNPVIKNYLEACACQIGMQSEQRLGLQCSFARKSEIFGSGFVLCDGYHVMHTHVHRSVTWWSFIKCVIPQPPVKY